MSKKTGISHGAIVLPARDVQAAIDWYTHKLGFTCTFQWGEPLNYAVLNYQEKIHLHLTLSDGAVPPNDHTVLYLFVHRIEPFYEQLQQADVTIDTPLGERAYGMKDFDVRDPDGYRISFGEGIEGA